MLSFMDRYVTRAKERKSMLCFGLDPKPEMIPPKLGSGTNAGCVTRYLMGCIDLAAEKCACIKPQWGFYHAYGARGYVMLEEITEYAKSLGVLVIEDAKVNDIGNTVDAYGVGVFGHHAVDAVTFTPYLGGTFLPVEDLDELWVPWLSKGCGVISMILTSNDERNQLQLQPMQDGRPMYLHVAELVADWAARVEKLSGGNGMVGGVVGATVPEESQLIRAITGPKFPFLVPGLGAQGATGADAVAGMPDTGEPILIINSSRKLLWDSWYDRKNKQARVGDPFDLVSKAIDAHNLEINEALVAMFGSLEKVYGKAA